MSTLPICKQELLGFTVAKGVLSLSGPSEWLQETGGTARPAPRPGWLKEAWRFLTERPAGLLDTAWIHSKGSLNLFHH